MSRKYFTKSHHRSRPKKISPETADLELRRKQFRCTSKRLAVLEALVSLKMAYCYDITEKTGIERTRLSKILKALEKVGLVKCGGRYKRKKIWVPTEDSEQFLKHGMRKKFFKKQDLTTDIRDVLDLEIIYREEMISAKLKSKAIWLCFKLAPLYEISRILEQSKQPHIRDRAGYIFTCLVGKTKQVRRNLPPLRESREDRSRRRFTEIIRCEREFTTVSDNEYLREKQNQFFATSDPVRAAFECRDVIAEKKRRADEMWEKRQKAAVAV